MRTSAVNRLFLPAGESLSIDAAASAIGVSTATIRNWVKAGHLTPKTTRPLLFEGTAIADLKASLSSGRVSRLRSRANKTTSSAEIVPIEYAINQSSALAAQSISQAAAKRGLSISHTLFFVALRIIVLHGEAKVLDERKPIDISNIDGWKRTSLFEEMTTWASSLPKLPQGFPIETTNLITGAVTDDFLGLLYQTLSKEGERSTSGSYYTPLPIVQASLQSMSGRAASFLDPCCGTGQYLIQAATFLNIPAEQIYGFDIDELATRIARINMLLAIPEMIQRPNIECLDYLAEGDNSDLYRPINPIYQGIDFLATNPPWGSYKNTRLRHPDIASGESFSLFIAQSISLLPEGASMSFLLPDSILNIKTHSDIRKTLLEKTCITHITKLGRQFSGVFTPVVRIDIVNILPNENSCISVSGGEQNFQIEQKRFLENLHYAFDIDTTSKDSVILNHIYKLSNTTLKNNADWALGIVTGNNKRFISEHKSHGMEAVYKGSDVAPFRLKEERNYIKFDPPALQQVAKEHFYRCDEKLIYKFISKRLVFAYDKDGRLTLNSANILIPRIPNISVKVVMAFLNSDLYQYLFSIKFSTHKVLRGDLESLPFPSVCGATHALLENLVDKAILGDDAAIEQINDAVYKEFYLSDEHISHISDYLRRN